MNGSVGQTSGLAPDDLASSHRRPEQSKDHQTVADASGVTMIRRQSPARCRRRGRRVIYIIAAGRGATHHRDVTKQMRSRPTPSVTHQFVRACPLNLRNAVPRGTGACSVAVASRCRPVESSAPMTMETDQQPETRQVFASIGATFYRAGIPPPTEASGRRGDRATGRCLQ